MGSAVSPLAISATSAGLACLLTADGLLDSSTYLQLRDTIVKAALDEPQAVLIDVNKLAVPAPSAWAVFTSARWLVDTWPAIPIHLVSDSAAQRDSIARNGITRYVAVHPTVGAALDTLSDTQCPRLRAKTELPAALASLRAAREFVTERLAEWSFEALAPVATVVANVFVENVLQHTISGVALVLETDGTSVSVSVADDSPTAAARHEDPVHSGEQISGLAIVASVCRVWGSAPTPSGKTVWAVIGPENRL
ncbi:ATP-binding protein [Candidatus Mycobacterium wuenschmannii]|uniref:ATP-binding protein n=1 Tax=Candidatus Mycobacterium wuenschmannii TaxID=3027808 RepID=A0ABY8VQE9_9MYCO|nr:ATP-binding protein [Candidatus Mycobacterium wuenschmannii]WIM85864.1 ATP-binding protein [Candidatus Mycobacterium wuenschmannii]